MRKDSIRVAPGKDTALYELHGVTKRYGEGATEVAAVDGIDLAIGRGEFAALVGPSGSGKTTMLQLLGAIDRPTEGEVLFEGARIEAMSDGDLADLRRNTLGFIFQQFNLIPTLTARENVEAAMAPTGIASAARRRRADELLERVGLGPRADHVPSQLSGGEQQRVAIARALSNEPQVVLADEPTGNLDTATGTEVIALLDTLWREAGLTLILVTHDSGIAERAPRVLRMRDGRLAGDELALGRPGTMSRAVRISWIVGGALVVLVVVAAVAIGTIGGPDGESDAAGSETSQPQFPGDGPPGGADSEALQAFGHCLEENGVELPEPGSGSAPPAGFDPRDSGVQEAFSKCQDELPEGARPPTGGPPSF
jgi:putative ABC transport system ATP-binding protein